MFLNRKRAARLDLDRCILNLTGSNHPDDHITLRDLMEHLIVFGSTGSGKSSTIGYYLARNILSRRCPSTGLKTGMIVFMYKDDIEQWYRWTEEFGRQDDVVVIDQHDRDVFNILEAYHDEDANNAVDTLMVLSNLSLSGGGRKDSEAFWEIKTRQRLHRLVLLNQLSGEPLNATTLYRIDSTAPRSPAQLADDSFLQNSFCWQMLAKAKRRHGKDSEAFTLCEDYFVYDMPYLANETASSILAMTSGVLEPFQASPMLKNLFCGKTRLSLDELLGGKIVILNLPIQKLEYAGRVAQMLFKHVLQKRIEARDLESSPNPVVLHIDEFQHLISEHDTLFMSTARSSRVGCLLMTQNKSGLYAHTSGTGQQIEHKVTSLLALANHKFFLAQNDFNTNEFAAKIIGRGRHQLNSSSVDVERMAGNASVSEHYEFEVMPHQFTMLKRGGAAYQNLVEAIVTATGKRFSNGRNFLKLTLKQPWA